MARPPKQDLQTFLRRQKAPDLVAVLLELANDHEAVQVRISAIVAGRFSLNVAGISA